MDNVIRVSLSANKHTVVNIEKTTSWGARAPLILGLFRDHGGRVALLPLVALLVVVLVVVLVILLIVVLVV